MLAGIQTRDVSEDFKENFETKENTFTGNIGMLDAGLLRQKVNSNKVKLDGAVVWYEEGESAGSFYHSEDFSDEWLYDYKTELTWRPGKQWDTIRPLLHPSLAGMDIGRAGLDDAFVKSLSSLESIIDGRKTDLSPLGRSLLTKNFQRGVNPGAFLMRAAVAWISLVLNEANGLVKTKWQNIGNVHAPKALLTIADLNSIMITAAGSANDWIFTRIENINEMFMIDIMQMLCSEICPLEGANWGIKTFWPPMNNPRVIYTPYIRFERISSAITSRQLEETINRFCAIFDCYHIWKEVLAGLQAFTSRPNSVGIYGGHNNAIIYYPRSDLTAAIIGPLYAGVSPQGMSSDPFAMPDWRTYLYWGAVKGTAISAALFEKLSELHAAHPIHLYLHTGKRASLMLVESAEGASKFWHGIQKSLNDIGLNCINRVIAGLAPRLSNGGLHQILQAHRVPWWTIIARHIDTQKVLSLYKWLSPARMTEPPLPNKWYAFHKVGATTSAAISACMRHTNAEVIYILDSGGAISRKLKIQTPKITRFCSPMEPQVIDEEFNAWARFRLGHDSLQKYKFIQQLAKAMPHIVSIYDETTKAMIEDSTWRPNDVHELLQIIDSSSTELHFEYNDEQPIDTNVRSMTTFGMTRGDIDPIAIDAIKRLSDKGIIPQTDDWSDAFNDFTRLTFFRGSSRGGKQISGIINDMNIYETIRKIAINDRLAVAGDLMTVLSRLVDILPTDTQHDVVNKIQKLNAITAALTNDPAMDINEVEGLQLVEDEMSKALLFSAGKRNVETGMTFKEGIEKALAELEVNVTYPEMDMPSDPNAGTEDSQVFGRGLQPRDSIRTRTAGHASNVTAIQLATESIGFAPPEHSNNLEG